MNSLMEILIRKKLLKNNWSNLNVKDKAWKSKRRFLKRNSILIKVKCTFKNIIQITEVCQMMKIIEVWFFKRPNRLGIQNLKICYQNKNISSKCSISSVISMMSIWILLSHLLRISRRLIFNMKVISKMGEVW